MHYKTNRQNHDFQIAYFIAGSCQTADAAYSILCDLEEDRDNAIKAFKAFSLRDQAKIKRAEATLAELNEQPTGFNLSERQRKEAGIMEAQADIEESKAMAETTQRNYDAALAELEFIRKCKNALMPLRKYSHLSDAEAHEAAQHDEWKLQLIHTAENHLLSGHAIPPDHYSTMRMHPAFLTDIVPELDRLANLVKDATAKNDPTMIMNYINSKKQNFNLPKLLGVPEQTEPKMLDGKKEVTKFPNYGLK
jgi:hypothetical protein